MAYRETILADSPVLYLRFGETTGTTAADVTANANNGTHVNTPTLGVAGALTGDPNLAITYKRAESEHTTVAHANSLDVGDVFSIEVWIKRTAHSGVGEFVTGKGTGAFAVAFNASGGVLLTKIGTGTLVTSTITITDANWHHIVVTKSGAAVKMWIDNADRTGAIANSTMANTTSALFIGQTGSGTQFLGATLDELAIYPTALSQAQVNTHYQYGLGKFREAVVTTVPTITPSRIASRRAAIAQSSLITALKTARRVGSVLAPSTLLSSTTARRSALLASASTITSLRGRAFFRTASVLSGSVIGATRTARRVASLTMPSSVATSKTTRRLTPIASASTTASLKSIGRAAQLAAVSVVTRSVSARRTSGVLANSTISGAKTGVRRALVASSSVLVGIKDRAFWILGYWGM